MLKITKTTEKLSGKEITKIFANSVFVCETRKGGDFFCTMGRDYRPSMTRNKWKKTYETSWQHKGLKELLSEYNRSDFQNFYPDTRYGGQGKCVSLKTVKELIQKYLQA